MSATPTAVTGLQDDDLGFRPVERNQTAPRSPDDDNLGFRPAQPPPSAQTKPDGDDLGFRPAETPAKSPAPPAAPALTPPKPQTPTLEAAPEPSFLGRVRSTIANSAIGHATEEALPKLADTLDLHPTETASNPYEATHANEIIAPGAAFPKPGVTKGVAEFGGSLTSPGNVDVLAATGGLGALPGVLGEAGAAAAGRLVAAGFSAQMIDQAVQQYPAIRDAIKRGDYNTAKQLMTEAGLGLVMAHHAFEHAATEPGQAPQERLPVTLDRAQAAPPEPIVAGDTVPDYLGKLRQRITDQIAETGQQDQRNAQRDARINASVSVPKTPETTEPPPILSRPAPRTPLEDLSAQADEVRQGREFRQSLTKEIGDGIVSRLRDEGLLEEPKSSVMDRRTVRPEDVEPYQRPRTFIGSENIPPSVVPRGRALEDMLAAEKPERQTARSPEDIQLGFRPAETQKALPPASQPDVDRIRGEEENYDRALGKAQAYGRPQPAETVQAASPQEITADSRRMANLAIGRFSNPVEKQFANDVWQSFTGQGKSPEPPHGMTTTRAEQIRGGLAKISQGNIAGRVPNPATRYAPDVLEEARAMMAHTNDFLSAQERPGRYFADMGDETSLTGRGPKIPITAVKSQRGAFPWFANLTEGPGELAKALARGKGPSYDRLLTAAADHVVKSRAEFQAMAHDVAPDLETLANQVRELNPELADYLSDTANGKIGNWTETKQDQLAKIEEKISDARRSTQFARAVEALASEERASGAASPHEGGPQGPGIGSRGSKGPHPQEERPASELAPQSEILPGVEEASTEHRAAIEKQKGDDAALEFRQALGNVDEAAGRMENESPLFRGSGAAPQDELFSAREPGDEPDERGFVTHNLLRDLITGRLSKDAYQKLFAEPLIEKGLGIGDKYAKVREADPQIADALHVLDNAPTYFRAKAAHNVHDIVGGLSRDQERLFTLMADADSRENLKANHPGEYQKALKDPEVQAALRRYKPIDQAMTDARKQMGGVTLDQDYLKRVYDEHVSGIGKESALGSSEKGTTAFDRVIRPQRIGNLGREATAEYHYKNGLHEFGPAFGTKFIGTNLAALRDSIARDFTSKATEVDPGAPEPRSIAYQGQAYFRPDIAKEMRDGGDKGVKVYDRYDPSAGVKYPQQGTQKFLGPRDVVRALNDYGADRDTGPGPVRRFMQEQVIGFGFGIPHVENILRRVTQSAPMGAANPVGWARAWKVAFGKELRDRGISGPDDPTFDRLLKHGAITTGEAANLKRYWGSNLNPANWARTLAGVGHKLIFDPKSFGGFGGVDQRARLYIADLVKSQQPGLSDPDIAKAVNTQLGDYNRANWNDRQKLLSKYMLFPGWDVSSIRWVIQHPIKTTVPPALVVWTANQILHKLGQNRDDDANDISNVHIGDRSIGVTLLRESMARNLGRPLLNYAQSKVSGETGGRATGAAARGITEAAGSLVGSLRPDLTAGIDLAMNRESPFGGKELVSEGDYSTPGAVLPNRALEKQAALVIRHAIPSLDRMLGSDDAIDFKAFAGSNIGLPNYQSGAEQQLKRNAAEAADVSATLRRLAKTKPAMARDFIKDPDNAAYAMFHNELESMSSTLKRMDQATDAVGSARNLSAGEKRTRLDQIATARQNLLRNADGLDRLLFQRKTQLRSKATRPAVPPEQEAQPLAVR